MGSGGAPARRPASRWAGPTGRVVALLGDGCTLFGVQALWTAARQRAPVTFVVFANGEYRTLKQTLTRMRSGQVEPFLGMDLSEPAVDWPAVSQGLGVPAGRATDLGRLADLIGADRGRSRSWSRCRPGGSRRGLSQASTTPRPERARCRAPSVRTAGASRCGSSRPTRPVTETAASASRLVQDRGGDRDHARWVSSSLTA